MSFLTGLVSGVPQRNANTPGPTDDFWYADTGDKQNASGVIVTPDLALKGAVLFTCVKIISETVASMPLGMYRELPGNRGREEATDHPLDELIRFQPNSIQTAAEFWEMMMLHAALRGTAYAEIVPGPRGAVDQLRPLHTDRVKANVLADGSLRYEVTNPNTGGRRILLQEEMFRIPGLSSDGVTGLRAVDIAAEDIGLGMAADAYASRVFSNKLNIGGYLVHPGKLPVAAQKNLIHALMERFAGINNAHRPLILQEGMKFERASMDAKDAQLIEARKWQTALIAMRWRIPLYMLGVEGHRETAEQSSLEFVKYCLRPWARKIEQAIRRDLIVAKGYYVAKFNMDALLRGDAVSQSTYFSKALGSGGSPAWLTQNEVRGILGFNPVEDKRADVLGVGTNPDTSTPSAKPKAIAAGPSRAAIVDDTPEGKAARIVGKEIAAIRKASMRFAGDRKGFENWVVAFYAGHMSAVMATLDIPKDAARAYCDHVRREVLTAAAGERVTELLDRWEETRPSEIAATLKRTA